MSLSTRDASFVQTLVYRRSAIVLDDSKHYLIESRLEPVAAQAGFRNISEMIGAANDGKGDLQTKIVEALTTNETFFFRDVTPFECLKQKIIPSLLTARATTREISIWCGACSTGQEPYSISMLLAEHFPNLSSWLVRIHATDIAEQILTRARAGKFQQLEMNRGLPAAYFVKYFERHEAQWEIKQAIRKRIEFAQLNLIDAWTLPIKPDIVFLRNVLIYFDHDTKKRILERVRKNIAPDGVLFLGAAETTLNIDDKWERVADGKFFYYRVRPEAR